MMLNHLTITEHACIMYIITCPEQFYTALFLACRITVFDCRIYIAGVNAANMGNVYKAD